MKRFKISFSIANDAYVFQAHDKEDAAARLNRMAQDEWAEVGNLLVHWDELEEVDEDGNPIKQPVSQAAEF